MSLNVKNRKDKNSKKKSVEIKAGTYMGRIVSVVDVGMQKQVDYETKVEGEPKEILQITVEFPKIRVEYNGEDKPAWLSKSFKVIGPQQMGWDVSNFKKMLADMMEEYDVATLIGKPVMCVVAHTTTGKPKIVSISSAPEEIPVAELENEPIVFDFYNPDMEVFDKLVPWMAKNCLEALDFEGSDLQRLLDEV